MAWPIERSPRQPGLHGHGKMIDCNLPEPHVKRSIRLARSVPGCISWSTSLALIATLAVALPTAPALAAQTDETHVIAGECSVIMQNGNGEFVVFRLKELKVTLSGNRISSPNLPDGTRAVACRRPQLITSTVDMPGDALIAKAGFPLYTVTPDGRIGVLEVSGSQRARPALTDEHVKQLFAPGESTSGASPSSPDQISERLGKETSPACEAGHEGSLVNGQVTIEPGQTLCIQLETAGSGVRLVSIMTVVDPATTLVVKMGRDSGINYLWLHNPLGSSLDYGAMMRRSGRSQDEPTSVCSVLHHGPGFEYWPYDIDRLVLSNFRIQADSATYQCK